MVFHINRINQHQFFMVLEAPSNPSVHQGRLSRLWNTSPSLPLWGGRSGPVPLSACPKMSAAAGRSRARPRNEKSTVGGRVLEDQ